MKRLIVALLLVVLGACAGVTEYEIITPDGTKFKARNTKDYESFVMIAEKTAGGGYRVELRELGVSASDPLKVAQEANRKLLDAVLSAIPGLP